MGLGASLLEPGEDSTQHFTQTLIRILVNHPKEQRKAQEEIDRVVGIDRMPTLDDISSLPYIHAIVNEVLRFRPFSPVGFPHKATEDVAYNGYRIPKNAAVLANVWGIFHDDSLFENPDTFQPERFLKSSTGTKPGLESKTLPLLKDMIFGTGRRVCPGMHLARNSLLLNTTCLLWAYNFTKAKRADGTEIEVDTTDCKDNASSSPNPFECDIRPRSQRHAQVIREKFTESVHVCAPFEQELDEEDVAFLQAARANAAQNS